MNIVPLNTYISVFTLGKRTEGTFSCYIYCKGKAMGGFMEVIAIHSIVTPEHTLKFELLTYLTGDYPLKLGKGTVTCCAGCLIDFFP